MKSTARRAKALDYGYEALLHERSFGQALADELFARRVRPGAGRIGEQAGTEAQGLAGTIDSGRGEGV